MRKLWSITEFRLKLVLKSKAALIMLFVLPIMFSIIFGGIFAGGDDTNGSSNPKVGIVVGACEDCDLVRQYLERNLNYNWQVYELEAAREAVGDQSIVAAVIIPINIFDRIERSQPVFEVVVNNITEDYLPLSHYIDGVANQLHMITSTLKISGDAPALFEIITYVNAVDPITFDKSSYVETRKSDDSEGVTTVNISVGFAVMFMMFAIANSASSIHQERKEFTWQRLLISGTSSSTITFGTMLAYFIVGWMQFATVVVFMRIVYQVNWGNIGYLIMFGSLIIMTVVSFSMLLVSLVNSKERADTLSAIIVVSTCMLGGVYWPISVVPPFMQVIGSFTPQYWMMKGLSYGIAGETTLSIVWAPIVILLFITVLFTFIVIKRLNSEKKLA